MISPLNCRPSPLKGSTFKKLYLWGILSAFGVVFNLSCLHSVILNSFIFFFDYRPLMNSIPAINFSLASFYLSSFSFCLAMGYSLISLVFIFFDFFYCSSIIFLLSWSYFAISLFPNTSEEAIISFSGLLLFKLTELAWWSFSGWLSTTLTLLSLYFSSFYIEDLPRLWLFSLVEMTSWAQLAWIYVGATF